MTTQPLRAVLRLSGSCVLSIRFKSIVHPFRRRGGGRAGRNPALAGAAAASREYRFNRHHQADDGGPARLSQRLHCTHALLAGAIDREEGTDI